MAELIAHLPHTTPEASEPHFKKTGSSRRNRFFFSLVTAARPTQWPKNLLLFAAPAAAGVLTEPSVGLHALLAAMAFTLGSAATYFLNDLRDMSADQNHPTKKFRPFAAGQISVSTGYVVAFLLTGAALCTAMTVGWMTVAGLSAYLVLTTAYSLYLKRFPVVDILAVALGFVVRAISGALATGVALTSWFVLVTFFGALYIVTAKRAAELQAYTPPMENMGTPTMPRPQSRVSLSLYTEGWLERTLTLALTSAIICYSLWAVQYPGSALGSVLIQASIFAFVATLLRYGYLCSRGDGQRPEHLIFSDGFLAAAAITWLGPVTAGIYLSISG
ncbi:decaprenyl-phosphate phosphoribosyltransferase [Pseudarthrobacter sp. PS3-L1]|uniref:decaprenyl-phosphate phosphoribosyltransferase n=1 Tax=Pseudarthrobacter sp. PS3-L1 TaxID=3046207 RepID=UPI0024BAF24D|nr:decaprenyl-phosphate phosphoribosyltransferase [Pseudarthrobacter sp. PS3-L1]MDJ0319935.1 decaprenyl-phosphate phosphoribosyltransferase [Pseudarthrobacter sp. PS3-L1]